MSDRRILISSTRIPAPIDLTTTDENIFSTSETTDERIRTPSTPTPAACVRTTTEDNNLSAATSAPSQEHATTLDLLSCGAEINITGLSKDWRLTGQGAYGAVYVGMRGVASREGHAYFNGQAFLWIPLYDRSSFGSGLTISLTVQEDAAESQIPQTLVSNCGRDLHPSFSITLDPVTLTVEFKVIVVSTMIPYPVHESLKLNIQYMPGTVKTVELQCDGIQLIGRVDGSVASTRLSSKGHFELASRPKPMYIGKGCRREGEGNFRGTLQSVSVHRCVRVRFNNKGVT
ncbi:uncharacterized protein LOC101846951 [Aplysia californica]|uniref:Uncharacterized protein LOC101846951 n=1 Tax=Aplysia californica TaxID=6500 RepID=A0ABM0JHE0_APLCA|nr:uncharacterized protein LOC101846951 [Aplysia californica]